ncbi:MAG: hypothetical protein J6C07_10005 [Lachnospiraceae bacterium]|nr:hypothetical protein [Lachnospiraceae bacterium]
MEKKNPYVTTVGFNKDDPDHVRVAELLNSMGRGKAGYLVKAVLAYQSVQESGQVPMLSGGLVDYELLRRMVFQILDERDGKQSSASEHETRQDLKEAQQEENNLLQEFDEADLEGMLVSMLAFQGQ